MGRPIKEGLDYFPLNTANDDKMDLLEAKFGMEGFAAVVKLWQNAYRENGYFYPWGEDEQLLFSHRLNVNINRVNAIIEYAVKIGIFDKGLFEKGVLTSRGMQKRYIEASKRRHEISLFMDLLLVNVDTIPVNVGKYPRSVRFNEYIGTQIEIEIKSNKSEKEKREDHSNGSGKKPAAKKSPRIPSRSPEENKLYRAVQEEFQRDYGEFEPGMFGREGKATWELIAKAKAREPDRPQDFLMTAIATLRSLKRSDRFFRDQPMLPSTLNSSGLWPRVIEHMRTNEPTQEDKDLIAVALRAMDNADLRRRSAQ